MEPSTRRAAARRRSRDTVVALLAVGVTAVAAACSSPPPSGSPSSSAAGASSSGASGGGLSLVPSCPGPPEKQAEVHVDALNRAVSGTIDLPAWQAADIGASARLSDGRIVWAFGDTVRPDLQPVIVANSILVSSGRCVSQLLDAGKGPVVPDADTDVVRWPMSVVVIPGNERDAIVVLCSRIRRGDSGAFGFTYLGTSAAVLTVEPGQAPSLDRVVDITPDSTDETQVNWGAAATTSGSWLYVYGTRLTGAKGDVGRELYVARAPVSDPSDHQAWRYWDGTGWQAHAKGAVPIISSDGGVSQTLSVQATEGRFVAVSKRNGDAANFVYMWTAPDAHGPWTATKELEAPAGFDTGDLEYAPLAHPEVKLDTGDLLVSISRNTTDLKRLVSDPEVGRPEFVQLPQ